MTNTDTHDIIATERQVRSLSMAGCDIIRITAPDIESVKTFEYLKSSGITTPLVADIHFNYRIAVACADAGVDKIRINPGNIGSKENIKAVVNACRRNGIPIRIGVNSGSLEADILKKYSSPTPEALAESALYHASLLEDLDFYDIVLSVKASNVPDMIEANRILADRCNYPIHLGVTEAGGGDSAVVKSSIGIGTLLSEGIGDTVRVSLTDDPVKEVSAAKEILKALYMLENRGMDIISCPTCGRTRINLIGIVDEFKSRAVKLGLDKLDLKVALMGCAVNGPGEAREADVGIAGGIGEGLIFRHGEIVRKVQESKLIDELIVEIQRIAENSGK
jgi:(E)-4-hydroxy-3-methylbut-2-enyl-diphosphate synthase